MGWVLLQGSVDALSKKRLAAFIACGIVGSWLVNGFFVAGNVAFLDCRAVLVVNRDGCVIPHASSTGGLAICLAELPPLSICTMPMPKTEYECRVLYRQYTMYEEHPWSYGAYRYETGHCDDVPGDMYPSRYDMYPSR